MNFRAHSVLLRVVLMPPKKSKGKTGTNYGKPDDPPDFDFVQMTDKVNGHLRLIHRAGEDVSSNALLMRRLRSAMRHVHEGLRKQDGLVVLHIDDFVYRTLRR